MTDPIIYRGEDDAAEALANDQLCRKIGYHLQKKYPCRGWMVEVVDRGRVCNLRCPEISMDYGMQFLIMDMPLNNLKKAEMMAGEILERFNLTRGVSDGRDVDELNKDLKGNVFGAKHGDVAANKPTGVPFIIDEYGKPLAGVHDA